MLSPDLKRLHKWLTPGRLVLLEACFIGLLSALAAVALKKSIGVFGGLRVQISHDLSAILVLPLIGLCGGYLSGFIVEKFAPEASGSGIPQVKAALDYVPVVLNLRVATVKLISTILALGSGLALGREGPSVQIGASLAAHLSRWVPTSPDYRRQLIAAGAAAGLATAFNAPIAGVIFVIEELLQDVSSLTISTAILASFVGGVVSHILGGSILPEGTSKLQFSALDIPFLILLGALVGCFAVLFNRGVIAGIIWNRRIFKLGLRWRIAIAGCTCGLIVGLLPETFRDSTALQEFLASGGSNWQATAVAFLARFVLTLIACSAETPGGFFAPALILGAALGSIVGNWENEITHSGSSAMYALAGMGGFFGAVAKVPITAFVIVFEITMDFNIVLPLMIVTAVAYLVAEKFIDGSLYTQILEINGIFLNAQAPADGLWLDLKAADIMHQKVETLTVDMTLDEAKLIFGRSHHRGFPVLEAGSVVGIITQTDLVKINERKLQGNQSLREIMTPNPVTISPEDSLSQVLYLLSYYKLSRLPVLDANRLVGIITRSDILRVEVDKLKGADHQYLDRSYVVYQTRGTSTGRGRLLVPLQEQWEQNIYVMEVAKAIAKSLDYEIECLSTITISPHLPTAKTSVPITSRLHLLRQAVSLAEDNHIPIHTQIRLSHDPIVTIQEVIEERYTDLLLLDWDQGYMSVPCDLVIAREAQEIFPNLSHRWLIVVADCSSPDRAFNLLPHLIASDAQVHLCHIFHKPNFEEGLINPQNLARKLKNPIESTAVCAKSIADAVVDIAKQENSDVIVLITKPHEIKQIADAVDCRLIFIGCG
ncbi:chloride channel protein EriC [Synechococcus sp. PCC 7502]|uniref:chloride channel protein n=1 Tax=Synechococcus sp. PCC 7502 TaxID=1173263 RepID=UPI00029F8650|nr:chloride channel protein [Synechococcus sp. PCC 7502]AFY74396.1 chloride channel protein EriC [Synechococcus sp. PCC 7502]